MRKDLAQDDPSILRFSISVAAQEEERPEQTEIERLRKQRDEAAGGVEHDNRRCRRRLRRLCVSG